MWKSYLGEFSGDQLSGTELERQIGRQKAGLSCSYNSQLGWVLPGLCNLAGPLVLPEVELWSLHSSQLPVMQDPVGKNVTLNEAVPVSKGKSSREL